MQIKPCLYLCLLFLFGIKLSFAQTAINVKLNTRAEKLNIFFQNHQNQKLNATARQAISEFSYLKQLSFLQPLQKQVQTTHEISRFYTLHFEEGKLNEHLQQLRMSGEFESVEPVKKLKLDALLTDAPNDDSINVQWHHNVIKTFEAWQISKGNPNVTIGVIDTGIDYGHPDLQGQFTINSLEDINQSGKFEPWESDSVYMGLSGDLNELDEDGNGFEDDVIGYDFVDAQRNPIGGDYLFQDADPMDEQMHGTFVSGIIIAKENNELGGAGVAPNCKVMTLRAFGGDGSGEDDDIARAIVYAADNGVRILNFSFGDAYPSLIMHEAIRYAYSKGVIMIASAGNGTGDDLHYPSSFDEVISISASSLYNNTESIWQATSYGHTVTMCAPGADIFSTRLRDSVNGRWVEYVHASGTSASAPMVAGTAALLLSQRGELSPQQVRGLLVNGTDDLFNEGWDHFTGSGRLNMLKSLQVAGGSNVQILSPFNDSGSDKDKIKIIATILEPELKNYSLEYQSGIEGKSDWITIAKDLTRQIKEDSVATWNLTGMPEGDYTLRLKVNRTDGFTTEDRIRFIRDLSPPQITLLEKAAIWDNNEKKMFFTFRSSDQGNHTLYYRSYNSSQAYQQITADKATHGGEFLLNRNQLLDGKYEYYISSKNYAGLVGQSAVDTFSFASGYVEMAGYKTLKQTLPMGTFVQKTTDLNNNGFQEVYMNEFDERLNFGRIKVYEYSPLNFQQMDSVTVKKVLLPKDIADVNGDGKLDLLCNVNDSTLILNNGNNGVFPTQNILYQRAGQKLFPAAFADTDNDGELELVMKNYKNYSVWERNGNDFIQSDSLEDVSGGYLGSIAPRVLIDDFDGDNQPEIIYGDYDGDFLIYEHNVSGGYSLVYQDTSNLFKAGEYLTKGDFDGDGKPEFVVITHTLPGLKNADLEYDPAYLQLRIFKANGNNKYEVVFKDYFYDIDTDDYNAATAGDLDKDNRDELIFTTFPRTYIIDYQNGKYNLDWFYYGSLCTSHIIQDFDGNGVAEFGLGRGDSTIFYEKDLQNTAPAPITTMEGFVLGKDKTMLRWQKIGNATDYIVFRGIFTPETGFVQDIVILDTVSTPYYYDNAANFGKYYFYLVRTLNNNLAPNIGEWSNYWILRPHEKNTLDSVKVLNEKQVMLHFSQRMRDNPDDKPFIKVNNAQSPTAILPKPNQALIVGFDAPFVAGNNTLKIDTMLLDAEYGFLAMNANAATFSYAPVVEKYLFLTEWEALTAKQATLALNFAMDSTALDTANYEVNPVGKMRAVEWADDAHTSVKVTIQGANFGALGYPISITLRNIQAENGAKLLEGEGNTATFTANKSDLTEVYVYPNPVRKHNAFDGVRFANLTQKATIVIYTLSGRYIQTIEETDGDGGVEWNMLDQSGRRIVPGIYLFEVHTDDVKPFIGKFTVIE
ncbi:MAG: S8 family serine peptidase [Bacteroidia bacterium]